MALGTDKEIRDLKSGRKQKELWGRLGYNVVIVMKLNYVSMEWVNDVEADFKTMKSQLQDHSNQIMKIQSDHTSQMSAIQLEHSTKMSANQLDHSTQMSQMQQEMTAIQTQMAAMTQIINSLKK